MSKMKHLLRKLHIGSDHHHHHNSHHSRRNNRSPSPRDTPASSSSSVSASSPPSVSSLSAGDSNSIDRAVRDSPATSTVEDGGGGNPRDFNFAEEEFQMQLAMALSASDPETRKDDESDQIKAAKQMSLACSPSVPDNERLSEFISLKYWNYNVVQYDEKVVDGFYDVYAIASNSTAQGKMPLLVDLQAVSIFDKFAHEVVLVNRLVDTQLQQLENKVYAVLLEFRVRGLSMNGLIQRIADLVVDRMGGPVGDAEEMMKGWIDRSNQLRGSLNTIVLPLGCLDVGLSRHRALLFKVLADRVNLPCMLVKGSLYTGTDEGAVNLIKFDDGSEYIIDLMGAPGTLIPAEVPSSLLLDTALQTRGFSDSTTAVHNMSMVLEKVVGLAATIPSIEVPEVCSSNLKAAASVSAQSKQETEIAVGSGQSERSEYEFEKHDRSDFGLLDGLPSPAEEATLAQERKVKDVSKYVISAAKDPEFAQKLHAVLLESGASPPPDLFLNINPGILDGKKILEEIQSAGQEILCSESYNPADYKSKNEMSLQFHSVLQPLNNCDNNGEHNIENSIVQQLQIDANPVYSPLQSEPNNEVVNLVAVEANRMTTSGATANSRNEMPGRDRHIFPNARGKVVNQIETGEGTAGKLMEIAKRGCLVPCYGHSDILGNVCGEEICPMLGEVAEWEIPWENLQIGERIGIGSYGEVYRADWNGTEVAVKKFLVQDFTCDVLNQFKCEAEMMIRLRHPNVVLFMGAVTRPPNLSILTEFLPRGSLYRLLHRSGAQIPEKKRMKMALDVARGMNYLHTSHPTVVHRDLKSPNLLVDKNWVVKVCDFGLSRLKHHTFLSSNSTAGTPEWMAPEVLRNEPSNEKCDVYSFGVILWELATLCMPWSGLNPMQVVGAVGFQNRRLEIPEAVDPTVAQIIQDCWENDPKLRPSFSQLIARLKGLQRLVVQ